MGRLTWEEARIGSGRVAKRGAKGLGVWIGHDRTKIGHDTDRGEHSLVHLKFTSLVHLKFTSLVHLYDDDDECYYYYYYYYYHYHF